MQTFFYLSCYPLLYLLLIGIVLSSACTDNCRRRMETFACMIVLCKSTWVCKERIWALPNVCVPAPPVSLELDEGPEDNAMLMHHSSVLSILHREAQWLFFFLVSFLKYTKFRTYAPHQDSLLLPVIPEETLGSGLVTHPVGSLHVSYSTFASLVTAAPSAFVVG